MFDGVPNYPDFGRFWETIDRLGVTIFYTAPTAIRALMREGDEPVTRHSRKSLRLLGTVGEPINPEAWEWYWRVVGDGRCPVVDTWWQTETGGILISPFPGATADEAGHRQASRYPASSRCWSSRSTTCWKAPASGNLCIAASWPGQMRTVWGDHARFFETYFKTYPGLYFTGDGCRRDEDGYYWITGRVDDVINVSGHRIGTAEVESALVAPPQGRRGGGGRLPARDQGHRRSTPSSPSTPARKATTRCARSWSRRSATTSARSPRRRRSSLRRRCPRPARARSCGASCARSPKARPTASATPRRSPIRRWSTRWWPGGNEACDCRGAALALRRSRPSSPLPADLAARLDPIAFFTGHTRGSASSKGLSVPGQGARRQPGRGDGRGGLVLDQTIREGSKPPRQRRWRFRTDGHHRYRGSLTDAAGPVRFWSRAARELITEWKTDRRSTSNCIAERPAAGRQPHD